MWYYTGILVYIQLVNQTIIKQFFKKLLGRHKKKHARSNSPVVIGAVPIIIPRSQHKLSRANVSNNALKVLYRLNKAGYGAYLVGGGVRDLLLGLHPKDFDIATNARPEEVRKLFRNCRLIGRRFRLAHVHFGSEIVEVATFRAKISDMPHEHRHAKGMILQDNIYGTLEEDAWRRDFTINALYYNIADFSVVDYCGGMSDLKQGVIRLIGNPSQRYHEDPVRLLRAARFAGKLGFQIHPDTAKPIAELSNLLQHVSPARIFDELSKLFFNGHAMATFRILEHYHLFEQLFPQTAALLHDHAADSTIKKFITLALKNTDDRIKHGKPVTTAFLFTVLLWHPLQHQRQQLKAGGMHEFTALEHAANSVIHQQLKHTALPKRITAAIREIWALQHQLISRRQRQILPLFHHRRFRAAYDFLLLRITAGEPLQEIGDWWTNFQATDEETRQQIIQEIIATDHKRKKTRRRKKRPQQTKANL